ncbi:MAG: hypothetical protein QHH75_07320 [Bacillota bacterium]|nr:hypothetical protein [Bacillota bacterium]
MDIWIRIGQLEVLTVENSAGIFSGENRQSNWSSKSKTNQGLGTISGQNNTANGSINITNDPDLIDMPVSLLKFYPAQPPVKR